MKKQKKKKKCRVIFDPRYIKNTPYSVYRAGYRPIQVLILPKLGSHRPLESILYLCVQHRVLLTQHVPE